MAEQTEEYVDEEFTDDEEEEEEEEWQEMTNKKTGKIFYMNMKTNEISQQKPQTLWDKDNEGAEGKQTTIHQKLSAALEKQQSDNYKPGCQVEVHYDFDGRTSDELTIKKGERLQVSSPKLEPAEEMIEVTNAKGVNGLVPLSYIRSLQQTEGSKEFDQFCDKLNIQALTKSKLEDNGLNNLQDLSDVSNEELKEIGIIIGQRKAVMRGIKDLKAGKTDAPAVSSKKKSDTLVPKQEPVRRAKQVKSIQKEGLESSISHNLLFEKFCTDNDINTATKEKLMKNDLADQGLLAEVTAQDLDQIGITVGQRKLIMKALQKNKKLAESAKAEKASPSKQKSGEKAIPAKQESVEVDVKPKTKKNPTSEFDNFCKSNNLSGKTKENLKENDLTQLNLLAELSLKELQGLGITVGQCMVIRKAMEKFKEEQQPSRKDTAEPDAEEQNQMPSADIKNSPRKSMKKTTVSRTPVVPPVVQQQIEDSEDDEEENAEATDEEEVAGVEDEIEEAQEVKEEWVERKKGVYTNVTTGQTSSRQLTPGSGQTKNNKPRRPASAKGSPHLDDIVKTMAVQGPHAAKKKTKKARIIEFANRFNPFSNKGSSEDHQLSLINGRVIEGGLTIQNGLQVQKLPLIETYRDEGNKIRKCKIGASVDVGAEKTLLLVGATGSGKSTMIDGMINYIFGIEWESDFRLTLVDLEIDEKNKKTQAESQTEWITAYKVPHTQFGSVDYALTIVDMPGFGDTRGIQRDRELVDQLKNLFTKKDGNGIESVDAVCFITQAGEARLTPTQKYIFNKVLEIFGNNIKDNIQVLITFADGDTPAVMQALEAAKVPYTDHFIFNNSALYTKGGNRFTEMFWHMGIESYDKFFNHLKKVKPKSLTLTAEVLKEREQLNIIVHNLQENIQKAVIKISDNNNLEEKLKENMKLIEDNKDFMIVKQETGVEKVKCKEGEFCTFCPKCDVQCHEECSYSDDTDDVDCIAMDDGRCKVCPGQCHWDDHEHRTYISKVKVITIRKTMEDIKKLYMQANEDKQTTESLLEPIRKERETLEAQVYDMVQKVKECLKKLDDIALKKGPPSETDYLELLIEEEKQKGLVGSKERINVLTDMKNKAELLQDVTKKGGKDVLARSTPV